MAMITPTFVYDFQRNLNLRFSNAWSRTLASQWWKLLTITQTSASLQELYEWMLETAQIRPTGSKGDQLDFEDLVAISHAITNENFGTGLRLNRNDVEDNKYDRAAKWAADSGNAAGYWPQRMITALILGGKTGTVTVSGESKSLLAYDGLTFFNKLHPVDPYNAALGTYGNLFSGAYNAITNPTYYGGTLTPATLARVIAAIVSIQHPGGAPRYLVPRVLAVDPSNTLTASVITGAEIMTDPTNSGGAAAATNMVKRAYSLGEPITIPELASEPGVFYVGCEAREDAFEGAFIYQERKPFELTSYNGMTQADLDRMNAFEWHLRGRNTAAYGHPYLFFRVEPS